MTSKGEEICRRTLERIFDDKFPTCRPKFLKNPRTNRSLEIDCYNHNLRLACEYQGYQHYIFPNKFHTSIHEFVDGLQRDKFKREVLEMNNIYFIEVPYTISHDDIESFLVQKLERYFKWIESMDT